MITTINNNKDEFSLPVYSVRAAVILEAAMEVEVLYKQEVRLPLNFCESPISVYRNDFVWRSENLKEYAEDMANIKPTKERFTYVGFANDGSVAVYSYVHSRVYNSNKPPLTRMKIANIIKRYIEVLSGKREILKLKDINCRCFLQSKCLKELGQPPISDIEIEYLAGILATPNKFKNDEYAKELIGEPHNPFISEAITGLNTIIYENIVKFLLDFHNFYKMTHDKSNNKIRNESAKQIAIDICRIDSEIRNAINNKFDLLFQKNLN